jgi:hypothetical protein
LSLPQALFRYTVEVSPRLALAVAVTLSACISAHAADVSGIWSGQITDRNGELHDLSFRFAQSGSAGSRAISGKMYGDNESTRVDDLRVTGDEIRFSVTNELNGSITTFVYTGTIEGDEIRLTRDRVGAKPDPQKPNPKQTIVLKRLT